MTSSNNVRTRRLMVALVAVAVVAGGSTAARATGTDHPAGRAAEHHRGRPDQLDEP